VTRAAVALAVAFAGATTLLVPSVAAAHKPSDAHLHVAIDADQQLSGSLAVALRDLDGALDLDADGNGDITWAEAVASAPRIAAYASERLTIASDGTACNVVYGAGALVDFSDGAYWMMPIIGQCAPGGATLSVGYRLLFDIDAQHRGIVALGTTDGVRSQVARDATPIVIALPASGSVVAVARGAAAVATSPAQLVFAACLVVPVVLRRRMRDSRRRRDARALVRDTTLRLAPFALATVAIAGIALAGVIVLPSVAAGVAFAVVVGMIGAIDGWRIGASRWSLAIELGVVNGLGLGRLVLGRGPASGTIVGIAVAQILCVVGCIVAVAVVARALERGPHRRRARCWFDRLND
jgi:hypothetical protein